LDIFIRGDKQPIKAEIITRINTSIISINLGATLNNIIRAIFPITNPIIDPIKPMIRDLIIKKVHKKSLWNPIARKILISRVLCANSEFMHKIITLVISNTVEAMRI
jgi:hypothetical protein